MKKDVIVTRCVDRCIFYFNSMDGMECHHPIFVGRDPYENMIPNREEDIPKACPLRNERVIIKISL